MTKSGNSTKIPFEPSDQIAAAPLESIVCTQELRNRPSRPPEYEKENRALAALARALADSPATILQTLADKVFELLHADSAGLSLLTKDAKKFYWAAVAGAWGPHVGAHAPRSFGPCGDVLDHDVPMLFAHWEQRYPYLSWAMPLADEGLLVPFYVNGKAVGTIWAVAHDNRRKFDAEDLRLLESMSRFASAAYQVVQSIESLKSEVAAREEAEAEVRRLASGLEAKVRRLVEANVVGILMFNLEGAITDANEAFLRMVQYGREDLASGRVRWTDLTPAEWHSHNERAKADLKATGVFQPFEKEYFRKDGTRVPVLIGGALFEGSGNEGVAFVVDLTEQKRAEAQLSGEKRLLEMVASGRALTDVLTQLCKFVEETAADCKCGVYLIDWSGPKFRIGAVPSLPATFNDPCEGLTLSEAVGPCGVAALSKTQVIATDVKSDPLWQSCAIRPLLLAHGFRSQWSTPIYSRDGRVLGTFAVFQPNPSTPTQLQLDLIAQVTHIASIAIERSLNEEKLRRSEAFLAEAQHLSLTGSFAWRVATNEITWSDELHRIVELGTPLTIERIRTRVHPEDVNIFDKAVDFARQTGDDFECQYRLLMPNQSIKHVRVVAHADRGHNGQLEYIAAVQDVTERRVSEEALAKVRSELAHAARVTSLGALTASIAHEVNQPLTAVVNNANACLSLLPDSAPDLQEVRSALEEIIEDADRASAVVARVRQLVRKEPFAKVLLNLKDIIAAVSALARYETAAQHVTIRTDLSEDLPPVMADRVQLQQVLLNLVVNGIDAMKATEEATRILTICGRREVRDGTPGCLLSVQDAGIGFKSEEMEKLFETFYTTKSHGMGMGLAISRSIIEAHGGRLWAQPNPGAGATFLFTLPAAGNATV